MKKKLKIEGGIKATPLANQKFVIYSKQQKFFAEFKQTGMNKIDIQGENTILMQVKNLKQEKKKIIKVKPIVEQKIYQEQIELKGIGFRATIEEKKLKIQIGLSHVVEIPILSSIKAEETQNNLKFSSKNKQKLTNWCHIMVNLRKPNTYTGKGLLLTSINQKPLQVKKLQKKK